MASSESCSCLCQVDTNPGGLDDKSEMARLVVAGEASLLATALLKYHNSHHSYYYGGRSGHNSKQSLNSRLAVVAVAENEDDDDEYLDDAFGISSDDQTSPHPLPTDPVLKSLIRLKGKLRKGNRNAYNLLTDPSYLIPFCEVVRNKDTSGPITGMALQSLLKFITYGLVGCTESSGSVQLLGDSVTKARFIATDSSSDEVVLMRILDVLKQLIIRGFKSLTDETICEIMQSSFRIAFEPRLSELLRKNAEQALVDMCRSLFLRVHEYSQDLITPVAPDTSTSSLIRSGGGVRMPSGFGRRKDKLFQTSHAERMEINASANSSPVHHPHPSPSLVPEGPVAGSPSLHSSDPELEVINPDELDQDVKSADVRKPESEAQSPTTDPSVAGDSLRPLETRSKKKRIIEPHGMQCINELLLYLTSLSNPLTEGQNSEAMINVGLNLLIVAFESAVDPIGRKTCLMSIVRNDLCFNIIQLLQSNRPLTSFALTLRLSFLIFTSLRHLLKYQMECLLTRLKDIITTGNAPIEYREIALEYLVGFFRHIPFLPHEIFFNYDLDPYASNLMDDLYQFFSKNCFSSSPADPNSSGQVASSSFTPIQLLSLDAFLSNLKSLHRAELCRDAYLTTISPQVYDIYVPQKQEDADLGLSVSDPLSSSSQNQQDQLRSAGVGYQQSISGSIRRNHPKTLVDIEHVKQRKRLLWTASDQFNLKPAKGVEFLRQNGLVTDEKGVAEFLRDNSKLDKKMIGEYLAHKNHIAVLSAFIETFSLRGLRLDEALRLYLEAFRLPGEAPLVSHLLEPFAIYWHESNGNPFENHDAAYTLSYAIIMLNVDQHNINVKKQAPVMTCEQFINNLRQVNGGKDFDPQMLTEIYNAIKSREIIMPAEQQGPVRDKYLWKCLLKRSEMDAGIYWFSKIPGHNESPEYNKPIVDQTTLAVYLLNRQIFSCLWGPTIAAMTFIFDKINANHNSSLTQRILSNGFNSCALLCSTYGHLDDLIVILCKFTLSSNNGPALLSHKSQLAAQALFGITKEYANDMRDSWTNIIDIILLWFKSGFLDDQLEIDDFALSGQKIALRRKVNRRQTKSETSSNFLFGFYSYFAGSNPDLSQEAKSPDEKSPDGASDDNSHSGKGSSTCTFIRNMCQPLSIIEESKFLPMDSLLELIKAVISVVIELEDEEGDDIEVFRLEMLIQITLLNRDRVSAFWNLVSGYLLSFLEKSGKSQLLSERIISAIFRLAIRFTPRPDATSQQVLGLLKTILNSFDPSVLHKQCTATALSSFISHCHPYIRRVDSWSLIFDYLLCVGIGCHVKDLPIRQSSLNREVPQEPLSPPVPSFKIDIPEDEEDTCGLQKQMSHVSCGGVTEVDNDTQEMIETETKKDEKQEVTHDDQKPVLNESESRKKGMSESPSVIPPEVSKSTQDSLGEAEATQPFIPSSSSVRDVEAYRKCVDILTVIIKEILPKTTLSNRKADAEINQMAIDSLITLRFYSLQNELLMETGAGQPVNHSNK